MERELPVDSMLVSLVDAATSFVVECDLHSCGHDIEKNTKRAAWKEEVFERDLIFADVTGIVAYLSYI